tara:strand:+ start:238 stop:447 length:210 start_codon:yes stop_codon:yes gene_type:complete
MTDKTIWVCEDCGSDDVVEKIWASINDTIIEEGVCYQKYSGEVEADIWCDDCNMETKIIEQKEFNNDNR